MREKLIVMACASILTVGALSAAKADTTDTVGLFAYSNTITSIFKNNVNTVKANVRYLFNL